MDEQLYEAWIEEARAYWALIEVGKILRSEDGENPEYDRALVEMVVTFQGQPIERKAFVAKAMGIVLEDESIGG